MIVYTFVEQDTLFIHLDYNGDGYLLYMSHVTILNSAVIFRYVYMLFRSTGLWSIKLPTKYEP
jgi:hypothetical protein